MAITKVQEVFSYTAAGGSTSKTITIAAPTAGNTLVLFQQNIIGGDLSSVSGGGVTWTKIATWTNSASARVAIWMGENSSGSGTTITCVVPNTYSRHDINVTEWSDMPSTLSADGGSNASTTCPNTVTPSITPTTGTQKLLLAANNVYATTTTAGPTGGFTALGVSGGSGYGVFAYQIVASPSGSYQAGWTTARAYGSTVAGLYVYTGNSGGGGGSSIDLISDWW